ncbi:type VI secretion system-associated protein TagF [Azospirillum halopraeferens]|uniref:type VI secretion system-associated protein TagF n=1 Tax=Azospirillum halopraeferens TaxID=34010 RepID=UPI0003F6244C|nr:type VI secretion system-associated protein TagF [Azospirillum halopraeferens]
MPPFGPGFHGKLPARGDFVQQGLPPAFLTPWDDWVRGALVESRMRLGAAWERLFAAGPVWRFALSPGLCGDTAVAGVLLPGADRVGRLYPFTVAASLPAGIDLAAVPFTGAAWYGRAEAAARRGDPDAVAAAVTALAPPPGTAAPDTDIPLHRARLRAMVGDLPDRPSLWWTRGGHWVTPSLVACRGLPAGERFAAFLDNGWQRWGWHDLERDPDAQEAGP